MAPGSEKDFDDDPYCAHCGESVSVKADCEFNEGDLCNECLYFEYPKMKRERDHLESLLAVAVGAINSILRADVRWRSQNELMFNKQQAERESIASLLKITGLTEQDFAALGIGD